MIPKDGSGKEALERLLELVRTKDLARLRENFRYLLSPVEQPSEHLERVREMLAKLTSTP